MVLSYRTFCDNENVLSALSSATVTNYINLTLIDLVYLLGSLAPLRFHKDYGPTSSAESKVKSKSIRSKDTVRP